MNVTTVSCTTQTQNAFKPPLKGLYIATEVIIAVLAIIGNFLVCLAVTRNKKLRTITNYFLVSLAVADTLVGLVAIPCAVLTDLGRPHNNLPLCLVLLSILMVLTQSSILSLLAVAAERYMAILLPFQYERVMSHRNAWLALLVTWVLGGISGSVPLMDWKRPADSDYCIFTCIVDMSYMVYFNFFFCLLVPLVAMFVIYGHIFLTVRRQLRCIAVTRGSIDSRRAAVSGSTGTGTEDAGSSAAGGSGPDMGTEVGTGAGTVRQAEETKCKAEVRPGEEAGIRPQIETENTVDFTHFSIASTASTSSGVSSAPAGLQPGDSTEARCFALTRQELRKTTSLFLVLFFFIVCWMPIHLINCVLLLCPHCEVPMSLTLTAVLLSHANSALNPILYAYRMRSFRHTLVRMWRGVWSIESKHQ